MHSLLSFFSPFFQLKTRFPDVPAHVLYDVLHDPAYRPTWDRFMMEAR